MKKFYLLVLPFFLGLFSTINANNINISLVVDGDPEEYCAGMTDTLIVSVDAEWESHLYDHYWVLKGDLEYAENYDLHSNPCKIVTPIGGYGKGRICYRYNTGGCTQTEDIDIYKSFTPPSDLTIEGPACVAAGDIVVFSVDPILTVNLNDQIGMDHYYWNVTDTANGNKLPFVDSLYYKAGDGSSVTFSVKEWGNTTPEVELYLGRCNVGNPNKKISLTLVKQAPKPEFEQYEYCLPYGEQELELEIQNALSSVQYSWELPIGWSIVSSNTDSTIVTIKSDKSSIGEITVYAAYKSNDQVECAITQTPLTINRRWGNNTNVPSVGCLNAGSNNYAEFSIQGEVPSGTPVHWVFNTNRWDIKDGDISNSRVFARPLSNAPLSDTIYVYEVSQCPNSNYPLRRDSIIVYVNPAAVHIEGETCVETNSTEIFHAVRNNDAIGPNANQYEWVINDSISRITYDDSIHYTIPTGISTIVIKMRPLGLNNCKVSQYSTFTTAVRPERTQGITRLDTTCITSGAEGIIEIQLENASPEQTYAWDFSHTHGYTRLASYNPNGNLSRIKVKTTGYAGNDTILGYAVGGAGCSDAEPDTLILTTGTVPFTLYIETGRTRYDIYTNPEDLTTVFDSVSYYVWKVDGEIEDEGEDVYDISVRKSLVTPSSVVELIVTANNNCEFAAHLSFSEAQTNNINPSMVRHQQSTDESLLEEGKSVLKLSPNPVSDMLKVELPLNDAYKTVFRIYDMAGKMLLRAVADDNVTNSIDVSNLSDGTYVLVANQDGVLSSGKFTVKH